MKRLLNQKLIEWRDGDVHKPIIMRGARQVGKTYLADQFGQEFECYIAINLEKESELVAIFDENLDPSSPYGIHFSALNYTDERSVHVYPLYAVANLLLQDMI